MQTQNYPTKRPVPVNQGMTVPAAEKRCMAVLNQLSLAQQQIVITRLKSNCR